MVMGEVHSTARESATFLCMCSLPLYRLGDFAFPRLILASSSSRVKALFAMSFTISVSLLILILLEVLGVFSPRSRSLLWGVYLGLDLVLLVVVLPYAQISILLRRTLAIPKHIARPLALGPMVLWLWLFYKIGQPFPMLSEESFWCECSSSSTRTHAHSPDSTSRSWPTASGGCRVCACLGQG